MENLYFVRDTMEVDSSEGSGSFGSGRHSESTETQDERNMGMGSTVSSSLMEITRNVDSSQLDANPGVDSSQLATTEPEAEPIQVDLTPFFVTDQVFNSREAIIEWCQEVGKKNNTVLVISHSKKTLKGKGSRLTLGCERSGWYTDHKKKSLQPKPPEPRKRKSRTRKCGCPFQLKCDWVEGNRWTLRVVCGSHNHELSDTLTGHAYAGRLNEEEKQLVLHLSATGAQPQQVLIALKEKSKENYSTLKTIYNVKSKHRKSQIEGKSGMQQLTELLAQFHYVEKHRSNEVTNEVRDIFWAHPESMLLAKCFPSILMVDTTCKTNRFKKPLIHVVGVSSSGKLFTVAFAFMEADTEQDYIWALTQLKWMYMPNTLPSLFVTDRESALVNAIDIVFPRSSRLFCTWHLNQQVQANCEKAFEDTEDWKQFQTDWNHVWQAETMDEYGDAYADFVTQWGSRYQSCIAYLRDMWLIQKEKFALAWTNKIRHFGNTTTKADKEHEKLRKYLVSSVDSYGTCWKAMHNMIKDEISQIKFSFELSLTTLNQEHLSPALEELRNHVSFKALELVLFEIHRSENLGDEESSCRCFLHFTHGLPCAHELVKYVSEGKPIPLSVIDPHWKQLSIVPIQESRDGFDVLPEYQLLRKKWTEAAEPRRSLLLRKIKDIATFKSRN